MKLSQTQLKQIIKEELQKTLYEIGDDEPTVKTPQSQPETQGPVIPDLPREALTIEGAWVDWKIAAPEQGEGFESYIEQNIGKFGQNNSVIAAYGLDSRSKPTCLVFIPREKFLLRKEDRSRVDDALKAIRIKLSENGFKYDSSLTVPGSQR